jgi:AraC family transcriptional regulator, alkane utilization regulator
MARLQPSAPLWWCLRRSGNMSIETGSVFAARPRLCPETPAIGPTPMIQAEIREREMDALSDVLRVIRLTGGIFLHAEFTAPWCISSQLDRSVSGQLLNNSEQIILYHYVREGGLRVQLKGESPVEVPAGHAVLFPNNDVHFMGSALELAPVAFSSLLVVGPKGGLGRVSHGGGGATTRTICGFLGCESQIANPLASALPRVLTVNLREGAAAQWVRNTLEFAADQEAIAQPGADGVMAKVSEVLFLEAVRRYIERLPVKETGWLAGLRDPIVGRALALLHGDVARAWTVEELGREVGASRSTIAERFAKMVGEGPMQYLTGWRMHLAAQRLRTSGAPLTAVAAEVGYESEAAFIRAFRRQFGSPPGNWRRALKAKPGPAPSRRPAQRLARG